MVTHETPFVKYSNKHLTKAVGLREHVPRKRPGRAIMTKPASIEIAGMDPYKFMAVVGKRVIHSGGRASSEALLHWAEITASSRSF
jgi:hypothetical protein